VVDLHLGAAGRARAAHHQVALGQGVDLAVAPRSGVAISVPPLSDLALPMEDTFTSTWPGCAKAGSCAVTITAATFLSCNWPASRRQADAHLLQVVGQRLLGVGHLRGLVARAVEADHQAVAGQLVAAHALHGRHLLDAQAWAAGRASASTASSGPRRRRAFQRKEWDVAFMASILGSNGIKPKKRLLHQPIALALLLPGHVAAQTRRANWLAALIG
jgi:hypothetical protein